MEHEGAERNISLERNLIRFSHELRSAEKLFFHFYFSNFIRNLSAVILATDFKSDVHSGSKSNVLKHLNVQLDIKPNCRPPNDQPNV